MNTTLTLSPVQMHRTFTAMEKHGGGFCSRLASAWYAADPSNKRRIDFGPGSRFYSDTH